MSPITPQSHACGHKCAHNVSTSGTREYVTHSSPLVKKLLLPTAAKRKDQAGQSCETRSEGNRPSGRSTRLPATHQVIRPRLRIRSAGCGPRDGRRATTIANPMPAPLGPRSQHESAAATKRGDVATALSTGNVASRRQCTEARLQTTDLLDDSCADRPRRPPRLGFPWASPTACPAPQRSLRDQHPRSDPVGCRARARPQPGSVPPAVPKLARCQRLLRWFAVVRGFSRLLEHQYPF